MRVNTKDDPRYQKMAYSEFKGLVDRHVLRLMEHTGIMVTQYDPDLVQEAWRTGQSTLTTARKVMGINK